MKSPIGEQELKLWFRKPAREWNEALPIGNGRLGGMVFGEVQTEHIQLNEDSVWYGGSRDRNNPDALDNLPRLRKLLLEGRIREAERLAVLAFTGTPESQRHYQPLGDLFLAFEDQDGEVLDYRRELDLETACITISYTIKGVRYQRRFFSSYPDQVMVIHLSADQPGRLTFTAHFERDRWLDAITARQDALTMTGHCGGRDGIGFCTSVQAVSENGRVFTMGDNLLVEKADSVLLVLSAATSFRITDYDRHCLSDLARALQKDYGRLLADHIADYKSLFDRVRLQLDCENSVTQLLPTDERLAVMREQKGDDPLLAALYFQFGRYLLISSSRPGTLPANLQGIWNKEFHPPWGSKYTININAQMNYWPAETCHLPECHEPLFDLIRRMMEPGRVTARKVYGCRGFTAHHNTDIWADTAPQDVWIPATYWPMGAAWLCLHFWEHYLFDQDRTFLKGAYPVMKEASIFFMDFLVEDAKGRLITCPTCSPENTYKLPNGESGCLCAGSAMDSQILYQLFAACIQASELLETDQDFAVGLKSMLDKLPKPEIGGHGQIQEWLEDYEEAEPGHRHISHLFGLHPGSLFNRKETPQLLAAAGKTLERRLAHGGGHTGWSRAWIINLWARLEQGEEAYENLLELLRQSTLPNLFDNHPPFQIDGNFGGAAGIAEMLLQSHGGEIRLLPALPKSWKTGSVCGLRARGGYIVSIKWQDGELVSVTLQAKVASEACLSYQDRSVRWVFTSGETVTLDRNLQPFQIPLKGGS